MNVEAHPSERDDSSRNSHAFTVAEMNERSELPASPEDAN